MTLDPLLAEVAQIALALQSAEGFALAGGGAMLAYGLVTRPTDDIDLFAWDVGRLESLTAELSVALRERGYVVQIATSTATFARLAVHAPDGRTFAVDLAQDARMRPPVRLDVGPVLHLDELAADKVLALCARAQARDLIDVEALAGRYARREMLTLAAEKDRGFDPAVFAQALRVAAARSDQQFHALGCSVGAIADLRRWALAWADELDPDGS